MNEGSERFGAGKGGKIKNYKSIVRFPVVALTILAAVAAGGQTDPTMPLSFFPHDFAVLDTQGAPTVIVDLQAVGFADGSIGQAIQRAAYDFFKYDQADQSFSGPRELVTPDTWGVREWFCGQIGPTGAVNLLTAAAPQLSGMDLTVGDYQLDASYCRWFPVGCVGTVQSGLRMSRFTVTGYTGGGGGGGGSSPCDTCFDPEDPGVSSAGPTQPAG